MGLPASRARFSKDNILHKFFKPRDINLKVKNKDVGQRSNLDKILKRR
jgi:hypothetical protein